MIEQVRQRLVGLLGKSKARLPTFLPLIGLGLFGYIVWTSGVGNIARSLAGLRISYLLLTPVFLCAIILLKGLKWKLILNSYKIRFSYKDACLVWVIGAFAGGLTPGQTGEMIKTFYLKQQNVDRSYGECLSTVAMDKILELISLMMSVILSLTLLFFWLHDSVPFVPILASVWVVFGGLYVVTNRRLMTRILRPLRRLVVPGRYQESLQLNLGQFLGGIEELLEERGKLFRLILLTMVTWLVVFLHLFTLTLALQLDISASYLFTILPTIVFVSVVPVSLTGLGTRDAAAILFFSPMGIPAEAAVAWSVLCLTAQPLAYIMIGWFLILRRPVLAEIARV